MVLGEQSPEQMHAKMEKTVNRIPAETIMSPRLTRGDTRPPKAYPAVPRRAEAVPAFSCSLSMASALDAVNDSPAMASSRKSRISYIQNPQPTARAAQSTADTASIPSFPVFRARSIVLNLEARAAVMAMATAFTANITLKSMGEMPKCSCMMNGADATFVNRTAIVNPYCSM